MSPVYFLILSLLSGAVTSVAQAQEPVACAAANECYPFEYCWNSICRELPPALRGDSVPGYRYTPPVADDDFGLSDDGGDDPIAGIHEACRANADCMAGNRCESGQCRRDVCATDVECGYQEICQRPNRRVLTGHCTLVACTQNYHCGEGHRCRAHQCR